MNKKNFKKNLIATLQKGFSLVELLVVVAIIGVLAGIGIVGYNSYIEYAVEKVNEANAKLLADAIRNERIAQKGRFANAYCKNPNNLDIINGRYEDIITGQTGNTLPPPLPLLPPLPTYSPYYGHFGNCVNYLVTNNQLINPYTNRPYGENYRNPTGYPAFWTLAATFYDIEDYDLSEVVNNHYTSDRRYEVCGACSDDVGGLILLYRPEADKITSYVGTCKAINGEPYENFLGEMQTDAFSYAYKFFTIETTN
jgi:prepilin-type N-terminal cleavage/methylation domain-containing protein